MPSFNRLITGLVVALTLMGAGILHASDHKTTSSTAVLSSLPNIAVLDRRAALLGAEQVQQAFRSIRAALSQEEQEIRTLANEAKKLQERLKSETESLTADEKRQLSKEVQEKAEEYQFLGQRLQKEQRQRQELYIRSAQPQLEEAIRQVIEAKKVDLLLDRQAVIFVGKRLDITLDVMAQLNKIQSAASSSAEKASTE